MLANNDVLPAEDIIAFILQPGLFDHNVVVNGRDAIGILGDHAGKVFRVLRRRSPA